MELSLVNVDKYYKSNCALKQFNYIFQEGIYGILGPNGAGKTTLMNILTRNIQADAGQILFDGHEIHKLGVKYLEQIGYMPQQQNLYPDFTGLRFLYYMASIKGMKTKDARIQIEELLHKVNLTEVCSKKIGTYSGGMKQRLLIAQSLLGNPKIVIMDEPTAGLDPKERIRIRNIISQVSYEKIVILATHVVSDIEHIAREILLLKKGNIVDSRPPEKLIQELEGKVFEVTGEREQIKQLEHQYKIVNLSFRGDHSIAHIIGDKAPTNISYRIVTPTLEDVYLSKFDIGERQGDRDVSP